MSRIRNQLNPRWLITSTASVHRQPLNMALSSRTIPLFIPAVSINFENDMTFSCANGVMFDWKHMHGSRYSLGWGWGICLSISLKREHTARKFLYAITSRVPITKRSIFSHISLGSWLITSTYTRQMQLIFNKYPLLPLCLLRHIQWMTRCWKWSTMINWKTSSVPKDVQTCAGK